LHVPAELMNGSDGAVSVVFRPLTEDEEERLDWDTRFKFAKRKDGRWVYRIHPPRQWCQEEGCRLCEKSA
jgi:hypothetical protein